MKITFLTFEFKLITILCVLRQCCYVESPFISCLEAGYLTTKAWELAIAAYINTKNIQTNLISDINFVQILIRLKMFNVRNFLVGYRPWIFVIKIYGTVTYKYFLTV